MQQYVLLRSRPWQLNLSRIGEIARSLSFQRTYISRQPRIPSISSQTQSIRTLLSESTQPRVRTFPGRSAEREAEIRRRNKNLAAWALAIVVTTVGLSYGSVPLYRMFCQVTGFGGTVRRVQFENDFDDEDDLYIDENKIVQGRPITIRFNADVSARVPWRFTPLQTEVVVLPGETALAFYLAENKSTEPVTGIATYNITPAKAAVYFNKVQCFCFDEQRIKPGEALDMPVFFYIDPDFADDDEMADVSDIMLSYTFFKAEDVTPEQLLRAQALATGHSGNQK